ncbi:MAG: pyridoxamine 5'-phosphate oxidase [Myxococcales bacterium]|nr:pyridoxamine 5'-phosphate oxidase [Myxococcales bacterium]
MAFDELRKDYSGVPLVEGQCASDPAVQFQHWFDGAMRAKVLLPNAMTLATVDTDGFPQARIVLLKELDDEGFVFFTNYQSRKGDELAANNKASLMFWWEMQARQVRILGEIHKVSEAESDAYFASRPRESNLAAMASDQSRPLESREALEARMRSMDTGGELQRPANWGGYRLVPSSYEFWQGRPDRTHDRLEYRQGEGGSWEATRLYP